MLPGIMMYFWVQLMGVTSVRRYSVLEFGVLSLIAWFPVTALTLWIISTFRPVTWTLNSLSGYANDPIHLVQFIMISCGVSFLLSAIYAIVLHRLLMVVVNLVRQLAGRAPLLQSTAVWDEIFGTNKVHVVNIAKLDKQSDCIIGEIEKVSKPFEVEKSLSLRYIDLYTRLVQEYDVPIIHVLIDAKAGTCIKIYCNEALKEALDRDRVSSNLGPRNTRLSNK